jgi:hypothetical protein
MNPTLARDIVLDVGADEGMLDLAIANQRRATLQ